MKRVTVRLVGVAAAIVVASGVVRAQATVSDTRLKAALVSKFPQFVEWPRDPAANHPPLAVCIAAPDPFGADLDDLLDGVTINARPAIVRRIEREQDVAGCQVLYLPTRPDHHPHDLLHAAMAKPILTISDDPSFLDDGGIIQLRVVSGRLRFDVDAAAARRAGLHISSQLLQLAMNVRGAGR
jgi:hypothetical protein